MSHFTYTACIITFPTDRQTAKRCSKSLGSSIRREGRISTREARFPSNHSPSTLTMDNNKIAQFQSLLQQFYDAAGDPVVVEMFNQIARMPPDMFRTFIGDVSNRLSSEASPVSDDSPQRNTRNPFPCGYCSEKQQGVSQKRSHDCVSTDVGSDNRQCVLVQENPRLCQRCRDRGAPCPPHIPRAARSGSLTPSHQVSEIGDTRVAVSY